MIRQLGLIIVCAFAISLNAKDDKVSDLIQRIEHQSYLNHIEVLTGVKAIPVSGETIDERFEDTSRKLARKYIAEELRRYGISDVYGEPFRKGMNLFAEIRGSESPKEIVVLGAHYDSSGAIPGANDNASGVAAVLEIAEKIMKLGIRPKRTIRFIFFDKEEIAPYYQGSDFHFEQVLKKGEQVKLFVNVDMIAHSPGGGKFACVDPGRFDKLGAFVKRVNELSRLGFELDPYSGYRSDNESAEYRGIPTVSIFEDPRDKKGREVDYDPENHSIGDVIDRPEFNSKYATEMTRLIGAVTLTAASEDENFDTEKSVKRRERMTRLALKASRGLIGGCFDFIERITGARWR